MKPTVQQKIQIEKTKRKKNRSQSEPKSYRNYFARRSSLQGILFNSIKSPAVQSRNSPSQIRKSSLDDDSSIKTDSSRSRQIKSNKQNRNALQKAEIQKFTQIISSLTELLSKILLPTDIYQKFTQQLTEINQSGLNLIKSKINECNDQDGDSDHFTNSWNALITTFQELISEPVKSQLILFFSSHINTIQEVMNNISNNPPTNLNFVPQWSSLLLQLNSSIKSINDSINIFKKQNENDIKNNMPSFSNLLKNFQLTINDTKLFKLSSFSMSKREEAHFIISKSVLKMIKYSEGFSNNQFTNGMENSIVMAMERINSFIPQLHQIFSSQIKDEKSKLALKKISKSKSISNSRSRASSQKNVNINNTSRGIIKESNSKIENLNFASDNNNPKKNNGIIIHKDQENTKNDNEIINNANEQQNDDNINQINDDESNDNEDENENNEGDNDDNQPTVNLQLKSARKYNKIFKKKLETTLQEEEALNNEITEKTSALESSRKLLRSLKLTRNQIDAVQRRNDAIKTKADLEKQLDSLRSEVSSLEENLRSKKDEHEQYLSSKKNLEEIQIENEYLKTMKKINSKYLRRLNSNVKASNSNNNPNICVSEITSSLLSPISITITTQNNQSSSTFDQALIDKVKKFQDELESVKTEYDKLIKERTIPNNSDNNNYDQQTLLRIYYDAQRYQQQSQTLQSELQAAQLRTISITKETETDSFFKSFLQSKKRELKELEKNKEEISDSSFSLSLSKAGPNMNSKNQSGIPSIRKLSQSSFFDRNVLLGRNDFDPMESTFNERSRLQQEYNYLQPGPQEETKRRRISIKTKLSKFPPIPEEYVQLDETIESLIFTRSQLKNAIESNTAAADSLSETIFTRDKSEITKMIARKRLEQLRIDFPINMKIEAISKKKFIDEQEKKKLEEEERNKKEEEEEEEEDKEEEESFCYTDDEKTKQTDEKKKKKDNISNSNSSFKINFNFASFDTKKKKNNQQKTSIATSNLAKMTESNKGTENIKKDDEVTDTDTQIKNEEEEEENEEEENEEEEINNELLSSLIRLREVNSERVEMEEKLRSIEEMFMTLFGDRIPPKVTLSLSDKIELVVRQFNKTK